ALPELVAVHAVAGAAEEPGARAGEVAGRRSGGRIDVDRNRAVRRAVAEPQLRAVDRVDGAEEEEAAHVRERRRRQVVKKESRRDVLHEGGAGRGQVAPPKLAAAVGE